jgi:probable phosphoglycerate mutase
MIWHILRHGEKEWGGHYNAQLRHQDEPLTAGGRRQAEALADHFAGKPIAAIYISEYRRTRETIACAAQRLGLEPQVDARLNEFDNGRLEGMSEAAVRASYPEVWAAFQARAADFRFPDGETGAEVEARLASFMADKQRQHAGQDLIIVAHDALIRLWMCHLLGLPVWRRWDFSMDFAGLTEIHYMAEHNRWRLVRFNQACRVPAQA